MATHSICFGWEIRKLIFIYAILPMGLFTEHCENAFIIYRKKDFNWLILEQLNWANQHTLKSFLRSQANFPPEDWSPAPFLCWLWNFLNRFSAPLLGFLSNRAHNHGLSSIKNYTLLFQILIIQLPVKNYTIPAYGTSIFLNITQSGRSSTIWESNQACSVLKAHYA